MNFKPKCKVIYGKCLSGMLFRTNVSVSPFITRELYNLIEGWEHKYVIVHLYWQSCTSLLKDHLLNNVLAVIWCFYLIFDDNKLDLKTFSVVVNMGSWLELVYLWKSKVKPSRDRGRLYESIFFYWCIGNFLLNCKALI